ncbi:MAG: hypothetical protein WCY87_03320 [Candidatus Cloacimonadales bacterium]|jgi:hypothetical protein|nr:hypothetical protein [Candidatus Cloacimonadota bacterium]MDY0381263.1 hypothetical protein [Candidatus Cloacimonadaceae bacterium]HCM16304.1 hypothetical protein [Candidatus Cloacimonas sp.]MCB5256580.1 hypothetical protein [Candidatus Cloacimonadota bacterium]MCB5276999.1 hypothetical protein [Candidatus Cloacimonadota bacterium]
MFPEPKLSWKSWPFAERPLSSALLLLFLAFLTVFLYKLAVLDWQMPIFYFLGLALVYGNLLPYFIITEYFLYEDEIRVRYIFFKIRRPWSDFGCFYKDKRGVMLSTFKMPRRLDPFRGQSLRFSKTQTEVPELLEILHSKIGKQY